MTIWVERAVVLAIHDEQLAEHGGLPDLRDASALQSALARPRNLEAYGSPILFALAASYGFGVARNHPFADGNKRTSAVLTELFLSLNGVELNASDAELVRTSLALASGQMTEAALATWLGAHA